jgi:hypothetical protein
MIAAKTHLRFISIRVTLKDPQPCCPGSDEYIVKLKSDITTTAVSDLKALLTNISTHEYFMPSFHGFASTSTSDELSGLHASGQVRHSNSSMVPY